MKLYNEWERGFFSKLSDNLFSFETLKTTTEKKKMKKNALGIIWYKNNNFITFDYYAINICTIF